MWSGLVAISSQCHVIYEWSERVLHRGVGSFVGNAVGAAVGACCVGGRPYVVMDVEVKMVMFSAFWLSWAAR